MKLMLLSFQNAMVWRALSCITNRLEFINDTYTAALVTYTLTLANHTDAKKIMTMLRNKAIKKGKPYNRFYVFVITHFFRKLLFS